jgi:hypothetical protein
VHGNTFEGAYCSGLDEFLEHSLVSPQAKAGSTGGIAISLEIACIDCMVRSVLGGMVFEVDSTSFPTAYRDMPSGNFIHVVLVDFQRVPWATIMVLAFLERALNGHRAGRSLLRTRRERTIN